MTSSQVTAGTVVGVGIGSLLGAAFDDMGVGIGFGMGIGLALAIAWGGVRKGE